MKPLLKAVGLTKIFGSGCPACGTATGAERDTNLCPACGSVVACHGIGFELYPGEVLGVVGESGSGKSTLVRLLNFEWGASNGTLVIDRAALPPEVAAGLPDSADGFSPDLLSLSRFQQRRIRNALMGIVYQNPWLGLRMGVSAGGNVAERLLGAGWRHIGRMRGRAAELLEKTEIPTGRMDEPPKNFSGGMQQRVQIAKALSNNPILLLLDEVTTGLDLSVQARVLDLIRGLQQEFGLSMLVVSHDLGVISLLCQRTMVMKHGRVVESGLTDQVLQDPQHPYTQLLVASRL
jgi:putative phosphonate transport system ATP-binding protein